MNSASPDELTYARFCELAGTPFIVNLPGGSPVTFQLSEVNPGQAPVSASAGQPHYESFSLFFEGPAEPVYPQATYRFEHEGLGAFDLFIVPVGRVERGVRYQAVFNRIVKA